MFFILEIFVLAIFLLSLQARNKNDTEEQPCVIMFTFYALKSNNND